ncbi:MAG: hypothetical protein ABI024_10715 [Vicinamibacterales bacterium]
MKRQPSGQAMQCLAYVLLSGIVTAAQAPTQKSETGVVATLSVTGCLERWAADATAGGDVAANPPAGVQFMLTQAVGQSASATSNSAAPQPAPTPARYLLLDNKSVDYAAHLNHRVRIDGTIAPQPSTGASLAQQIVDPATRETNLPDKAETASYSGNLVDVSALTMVARNCKP